MNNPSPPPATATTRLPIRTLAAGFLVVALFYGGLAGILMMRADQTLARQEAKLASQTVIIERVTANDGSHAHEDHIPEDIDAIEEQETEVLEDTPHEPAPEPIVPADMPPEEAVQEDPVPAGGLSRAPIDGLYQDTNHGRLPVIREKDRTRPFDAYRRPVAETGSKNRIALVFIDVGLSETMSKTVLGALPADISVAINPYATSPDLWVSEARRAGHEPWLVLPVETALYPMDDPGPQTLLIRAVEQQNLNKLYWTLSRTQGYVGLISGYQPAFMRSATDVRPVLGDIYGRGLGFVDGDTSPSTTPMSMADGYRAPYDTVDVWVGKPDATAESVGASLRQLEMIAESQKSAIGFITVSPLTIELVKSWLETLPNKNIALVPLSALAETQTNPSSP